MPELLLLSDGKSVLRCPLHGQIVTVGRSSANDISIPDDKMPTLHCSFEVVGGKYHVLDRGGQGVFIAGDEYEHKELADGDEVTLGQLVARYSAHGGVEEPLPTVKRQDREQRTGILRTRSGDGKLTRLDLRLRLPESAGGGRVEVPAAGLRIGAGPDNDIVVDDGFTSSFHAQLFVRNDRLFVRDLDSTNGTFLDGVRVVEAEVAAGAVVRFGKIDVHVEADEVEEPVVPPTGQGPWHCVDLHTSDAEFAKLFKLIEKVAPHEATVCVFGETGTGKELVAQAIHRLSNRRTGPIVPLNCAAVPSTLIESELFGHEKGAFTGADRQRLGAFEEANKGTLFLDEVGELSMDVQAKLLRVLETRSVRRVGGKGDVPVDARVVCATHRDLAKHVKEGKFREDLLHRLYVIPLRLPALRERPSDIGFLARHFIAHLSPVKGVQLSDAAEKKLRTHAFGGNVRELRNVIQRALIMGSGRELTDVDIVFVPVSLADATLVGQVYKAGMTMEEVEKSAYRGALETYGSAAEAARALGLAKTTFWRRATALGVLGDKS